MDYPRIILFSSLYGDEAYCFQTVVKGTKPIERPKCELILWQWPHNDEVFLFQTMTKGTEHIVSSKWELLSHSYDNRHNGWLPGKIFCFSECQWTQYYNSDVIKIKTK